ncbi:hypothetical protein F5146DRAFT_1145893 [Armillaria mellea]|nr:hypothetical protein F5146DRAFT_1145893 [Armillaria mellea]
MAEALRITSSITIFKYLKDVKKASKECDSLSVELSGLVGWLNEVKLFTQTVQPDDPWLVTMQRLSGPIVQLTTLLEDLKRDFKLAPDGTPAKVIKSGTDKIKSQVLEKVNMVMCRLLWKFKKENHDHFTLSQEIDETLANVDMKIDSILNGNKEVKQVTDHIDTNVLEIHGQVAHISDSVFQ